MSKSINCLKHVQIHVCRDGCATEQTKGLGTCTPVHDEKAWEYLLRTVKNW